MELIGKLIELVSLLFVRSLQPSLVRVRDVERADVFAHGVHHGLILLKRLACGTDGERNQLVHGRLAFEQRAVFR